MSIDLKATGNKKSSSNSATSSTQQSKTSSSIYEQQNLLCKNKCGYYGNSMQYEGYCSICYRKLKQAKYQHQSNASSSYSISTLTNSFDDSSSLLPSSQSFSSNLFSLDERNNKNTKNQVWNEQNLNKFASRKKQQSETRRNSTFKLFRRPSSTFVSAVDTVTKVADKAVNIVDQSISSSSATGSTGTGLPSLNQLANNFILNANMADANFVEFNNSLNKLVSPPTLSMDNRSFSFNSSGTNLNGFLSTNVALSEFEEQFRLYFPQLYAEISKKMKQFVDKFIEAFKRKDAIVFNGNKQYEIVQDFFKTIYKYILTSAPIKAYLEKSAQFAQQKLSNSVDVNLSNLSTASSNASDTSFDLSNSSINVTAQNVEDAEKLNEAIMIMVESYVTSSIYDFVFPTLMTEFEEQDMSLQKRIRGFYWVTNEMIGTCIDENSIFYRDSYEEALNYIVEMDAKRTAYEKMLCITECSKNIYKAINISANIKNNIVDLQSMPSSPSNEDISMMNTLNQQTAPGNYNDANSLINISSSSSSGLSNNNNNSKHHNTSSQLNSPKNAKSFATADDYLPAFIYIVLKANPTMLYSNMNFISRFAFEKRILQGEHAYHFCSLNAIINHIENLNAQHLNMSEEEFESYSNGSNEQNGSANIFKIIHANLKILAELKDKQKMLKQEAFKLQSDMNMFRQSMQSNYVNCLLKNKPKHTENIEGFQRPVVKNFMDDFDVSCVETKLAEPIQPTSLIQTAETDSNGNSNKENVKQEEASNESKSLLD